MADPQEVIRMTRMLEVEELSFRLQLKDAVRELQFLILFSPSAMSPLFVGHPRLIYFLMAGFH